MALTAPLDDVQIGGDDQFPGGIATAATTGITRLPHELLAQIFEECSNVDPDSPLVISNVNKLWAGVALSAPRAWTTLKLVDASEAERELWDGKGRMWVRRSGVLPFDVEIVAQDRANIIPALFKARNAMDRWRSLRVTCPPKTVTHLAEREGYQQDTLVIRLIDGGNKDVLDEFRYANDEYMDDGEQEYMERPGKRPTGWPLRNIHLAVVLDTLPPTRCFSRSPLTMLTELYVAYRSGPVTLHDILEFASKDVCPALQVLHLDYLQQRGPPASCTTQTVFHLPRLLTLALRAVRGLRCFLSHIHAPSLEWLSLQYINTVNTFDDVRYSSEFGDSDDEAQDFSQSPWTDHATGMGLRGLYGRGAPPLRALDMDYADMRTKDFKWTFAHYPTLEVVRIVASDMSDNVLRALRPSLDDVYLPLPSLVHLELAFCQRFTGNALVEMIISRLNAAEKGWMADIQHLHVNQCKLVTAEHYHELLPYFTGQRQLFYTPYEPDEW